MFLETRLKKFLFSPKMPGKVMHADTSKFEKIETRFYEINFFFKCCKSCTLITLPRKSIRPFAYISDRTLIFKHPKNVLGFGFWINFYLQ